MLVFFASPGLRLAPPVMTASGLKEACTMGGGRPSGTMVRQMNGLVVPTASSGQAPVPTTADGLAVYEEACTVVTQKP